MDLSTTATEPVLPALLHRPLFRAGWAARIFPLLARCSRVGLHDGLGRADEFRCAEASDRDKQLPPTRQRRRSEVLSTAGSSTTVKE